MLRRRLQQQRQQQQGEAGCGPPSPAAARQQQFRRRPGPQAATLSVPLPVTPTATECGALLKTLIKHLLFQRSQIPYLYDELLRAGRQRAEAAAAVDEAGAGGRRHRRRAPNEDRRLLKFLGKMEEAFAAMDAAMLAFGVPRRCFLLLGSSTSKPREAYEVVMPTAAAAAAAGPPAGTSVDGAAGETEGGEAHHVRVPGGRPRASRQERLCQLALRQLVMAGAELPEGTADKVPCKLFILLEGSSSDSTSTGSAARSTEQQQDGGQQQQGQGFPSAGMPTPSGAAAAAPQGFAVKRQFRLSMRKGVHFTLLLGQRPEEVAQRAQQPAAPQEPHAQQQVQAAGAASEGSQGMDCCGSHGGQEAPTVHLSQLPDAEPVQAGPQPHERQVAAVTAAVAAGAAAGGCPSGSSGWYLCKTVVKGLNSGSKDDGTTG